MGKMRDLCISFQNLQISSHQDQTLFTQHTHDPPYSQPFTSRLHLGNATKKKRQYLSTNYYKSSNNNKIKQETVKSKSHAVNKNMSTLSNANPNRNKESLSKHSTKSPSKPLIQKRTAQKENSCLAIIPYNSLKLSDSLYIKEFKRIKERLAFDALSFKFTQDLLYNHLPVIPPEFFCQDQHTKLQNSPFYIKSLKVKDIDVLD